MDRGRLVLLLSLMMAAAAVAGCTSPETDDENVDVPDEGEETDDEPAQINEVEFVATDYAFDGPETVPAGMARITLRNDGMDFHHLNIFRLDEGKTVEDFQAGLSDPNVTAPPDWVHTIGGPNAVSHARESVMYAELAPGTHVLLCFIPDAEGTPHFMLGMVSTFEVEAADQGEVALPEAVGTVELADFSFGGDLMPVAGTHVVDVENVGAQPHELTVIELVGNATAEDFVNFFDPNATHEGPPPGLGAGGVAHLDVDASALTELTFESGKTYAYICFFEDEEPGAPHFALGMMEEFTVA